MCCCQFESWDLVAGLLQIHASRLQFGTMLCHFFWADHLGWHAKPTIEIKDCHPFNLIQALNWLHPEIGRVVLAILAPKHQSLPQRPAELAPALDAAHNDPPAFPIVMFDHSASGSKE